MTFRDNVSAAIKAFRDAHLNADTDGDATAMHHTLGLSPYQAAPGNHNHDADYSDIAHTHTVVTSASASPSGGGFSGQLDFYKIADSMVIVSGYLDNDTFNNTTLTDSTVDIPVGYRPSSQQYSMAISNWTNTAAQYRYRFDPDGTVMIQRNGASTTFMSILIAWPL